MAPNDDRLLAKDDNGNDLYASCVLTVEVDGQPPEQLSGKRMRLFLAASARRVLVELDADNRVNVHVSVLHDTGDDRPDHQELTFAGAAVY